MQNNKNILYVKSLHRTGKYTFESNYGEIEVEIKKLKGCDNYYIYVDGRKTGLSRGFAEEAYELLGKYLGILVLEGDVK